MDARGCSPYGREKEISQEPSRTSTLGSQSLGFLKNRLAILAQDERVTEEDLKKLLDSMLGQDIWGVLAGIFFGGLLAAALTKGIDLLMIFNIFYQPVLEASLAFVVAVALVGVILIASYSATETSLIFKGRLMKQYLEAREIVRNRTR